MTGNKCVMLSLNSTCFFPSVTLVDGSTSSIQDIGIANVYYKNRSWILTWLYLMKSHSEIISKFQNFCSEIKTQFNTSVKI